VTRRRTLIALAALAILVIVAGAASARVPAVASAPIVTRAPDGQPGKSTGTDQGSDQGEDQGENISQYARGTKKVGPTTVEATNQTTAGSAHGGDGGSITATFENHIVTTCGTPAPHIVPLPETAQLTAGAGGRGGSSGAGQGADQGEDQGENIGQHAFLTADVSPSSVTANNTNTSGDARGGMGGSITLTFHNITTCVPAGTVPQHVQPAPPVVTRDAQGNIRAVYSAATTCDGSAPQAYDLRAGNGGAAGSSASDQGSDQGEDQGENIGQYSSGGTRGGPTHVRAKNTLTSGAADGAPGASINVTFDNSIDLTCAQANVSLGPTAPVVAVGGKGGAGGSSGNGQGSDQGEDQGENIGKDAKDGARIGRVAVVAHNLNVSGDASGGAGGGVIVTYNDEGTCSATPATQLDERFTGTAGSGGPGGASGTDQGSDQGEDQGENIGQFALGRVYIGNVGVYASNTNRAGVAHGGDGGKVEVGYRAGSCSPPAGSRSETATAAAGNGGKGGSSGRDQGADQGEDQGENIGQHAQGSVRFGRVIVHAINLNVSAAANGGAGGSVVVRAGTPTCSTPSTSPDSRVRTHQGAGGAGGSAGHGQGADQGEDQGENIGKKSSAIGRGHTSVSAQNHNEAGNAKGGAAGAVQSFACSSSSRALSGVSAHTRAGRQPFFCNGTFTSTVYDLVVPAKATCRLSGRARIRHTVEVEVGGMLIDTGAQIKQDLIADAARGIRILGGSVGHDIAIEATAGSAPGGNAVCGVRVGHDLAVQDSARESGVFTIGGIRGCAGNVAGHDVAVQDNLGGVIVARNHAAHNADCALNRSIGGGANKAPRLNTCPRRPL
jgi:hypothetical protein